VLRFEHWTGTKKELSELCSAYGELAYVDEGAQGYVRFKSKEAAAAAFTALAAKGALEAGTASAEMAGTAAPGGVETAVGEKAGSAVAGVAVAGEAGSGMADDGDQLAGEGAAGGKRAREESGYTEGGETVAGAGGERAAKRAAGGATAVDGGVNMQDEGGVNMQGTDWGNDSVPMDTPAAAPATVADAPSSSATLTPTPTPTPTSTASWHMLSDTEVDSYWTNLQLRLLAQKKSFSSTSSHPPNAYLGTQAERGLVLAFDGAGPDAQREEFKDLAGRWGEVKFVDFNRGDTSGYVRFAAAGGAAAALAGLQAGEIPVGGAAPEWRLLGVEEEQEYKSKVVERLAAEKEKREAIEKGLILRFEGAGSGADREEVRLGAYYCRTLPCTPRPSITFFCASSPSLGPPLAPLGTIENGLMLRFEGAGSAADREEVRTIPEMAAVRRLPCPPPPQVSDLCTTPSLARPASVSAVCTKYGRMDHPSRFPSGIRTVH
jgi:hypothetical protein